MSKRYYWLKLKRDFFKRHDTRVIQGMPNGEKYLLFYLKLLAESIDHEGYLRFSDTVPYDENMLAAVTETDVDIVRSACKVFVQLGMMERMNDETLYMTKVYTMIGSETAWATKKREYRQRKDLDADEPPRTMSGQSRTMSDKSKSKSIESRVKREERDDDVIATYRDQLSRRLPTTAWRDQHEQSAALHRLAKMTRETQPTTPVDTPDRFATLVVEQYERMKRGAKSEFWKNAAYDPKGLELRFSDVVTQLAATYGQAQEQQAGVDAMKRMGLL
jgi:predicted phage replisome organizer